MCSGGTFVNNPRVLFHNTVHLLLVNDLVNIFLHYCYEFDYILRVTSFYKGKQFIFWRLRTLLHTIFNVSHLQGKQTCVQTTEKQAVLFITSYQQCCRWSPSACTGNHPGLHPHWPLHLATPQDVMLHSFDELLETKRQMNCTFHSRVL